MTENRENTGRWLEEEHERFLQGLKLFGKKWTRVAQVVRTRTTVQVRSHAQKHFQKMVKGELDDDITHENQQGTLNMMDQCDSGKGVPPVLQPYVPGDSCDIAIGLYNYLSPKEVHGKDHTDIPTWYRHGQEMEHLLTNAETLDWQADIGRENQNDDPTVRQPVVVYEGPSHEYSLGTTSSTENNPVSEVETDLLPKDHSEYLFGHSRDLAGSICGVGSDSQMLDHHFSTMEVDDHLFEALIEDHEFRCQRRMTASSPVMS